MSGFKVKLIKDKDGSISSAEFSEGPYPTKQMAVEQFFQTAVLFSENIEKLLEIKEKLESEIR